MLKATLAFAAMLAGTPLFAATLFSFSTGDPDGLVATLSRRPAPGLLETETADDFLLTSPTKITHATFTGLIPAGLALSDVTNVEIELYRVFPADSTDPPSGNVPTRMNSPADDDFAAFDAAAGDILFTATQLNPSFSAANSVVNGIFPKPGNLTLGEGPVSGQEVLFDITFASPLILDPGHYFFRPEVGLTDGNFLWLSAPKPIVAPGTPFLPDLQSWIRNENIAPDWLRIGTDITGGGPFNAAFSLSGTLVPEPSAYMLLGAGLLLLSSKRVLKG